MPGGPYGLVLFLGTLYHLKNPFYVLEQLARVSEHCLLSTRIARRSPDGKVDFSKIPIGYLLDDRETNGDTTNYWIFSQAGLEKLLRRTGWTVVKTITTGDTEHSDPVNPDRDERGFCLLRGAL